MNLSEEREEGLFGACVTVFPNTTPLSGADVTRSAAPQRLSYNMHRASEKSFLDHDAEKVPLGS